MQIRKAEITRQQVIELAKTMPFEKLANWYEYGIFIQSKSAAKLSDDSELAEEFKEWEAASNEDHLRIEQYSIEKLRRRLDRYSGTHTGSEDMARWAGAGYLWFMEEAESEALGQAARYAKFLKVDIVHLVFFVEYINDEYRDKYEVEYYDKKEKVRVVPVFVATGK